MEELKTDNNNSNLPKSNFRKKFLGVVALAITICIWLILLQSRMSNLENRQEALEKMTTVQDCDHPKEKILRINFDFILDSNKYSNKEEPCKELMNIGNLRIEFCSETKPRSKRSLDCQPRFGNPCHRKPDLKFQPADKPINFVDRRRPVDFGSPSQSSVEHNEYTMKFTINQNKAIYSISNEAKVQVVFKSDLVKITLNNEEKQLVNKRNTNIDLDIEVKSVSFGTIENIHVTM